MENATKALLIAAAILIIILVLASLAMFSEQLSSYFAQKHDVKMVEQLTEFNNKFENYNSKTIRGNELISVMNRVIDYNNYQAGMVGYGRIILSIDLQNHQNDLKYKNESGLNSVFSNSLIINTSDDTPLKNISELSGNLTSGASGITGLSGIKITDTMLQKMSGEIHNIVNDAEAVDLNAYKIQRAQKLTQILRHTINKDDNVDGIKQITYQYYQLTWFKRAMFKCTDIIHDQTTGRVNRMNFKVVLETDASGHTGIKFD